MHVVVVVVSFPYCKDLIPIPKCRLVSFLDHGMGLRLVYIVYIITHTKLWNCTSTPIPCFCSLVLGSPIQHVNPDAHALDWFHFSFPPGDQEHEQFEDADTD